MKKRNPLAVILLTMLTLGIYGIYWLVKTKTEMNKLGANIPTAILIIIPFANFYWYWKYSQGVEKVTANKLNGLLVFIGYLVVGIIMTAIVQDSFNNIENLQTASGLSSPEPMTMNDVPASIVVAESPAPAAPSTPITVTEPVEPMPPTPPVSPVV